MNSIEKIYFDNSTYIWKTKLNLSEHKKDFIKEANDLINEHIVEDASNLKDAYGYKNITNDLNFIGEYNITTHLDKLFYIGIKYCKEIYLNEISDTFNKINTDSWINIVRSKNPIQYNFHDNELNEKNKYHIHTEINEKIKSFIPQYTYVYYIQMPDVMEEDDGLLFIQGENKKEYWIKPAEDDLIIMPANLPHAPNNAPNANLDRIVMAGNVGFEFIKKIKTLF